jgi:hypothetical protein
VRTAARGRPFACKVSFSVSSPTARDSASNLPIIPSRELQFESGVESGQAGCCLTSMAHSAHSNPCHNYRISIQESLPLAINEKGNKRMTPERWQQIRGVLEEALELPPEQRSAFLQQNFSGDPSLWQEVETLLASSPDVRSSRGSYSKPRFSDTSLCRSGFPAIADKQAGRPSAHSCPADRSIPLPLLRKGIAGCALRADTFEVDERELLRP